MNRIFAIISLSITSLTFAMNPERLTFKSINSSHLALPEALLTGKLQIKPTYIEFTDHESKKTYTYKLTDIVQTLKEIFALPIIKDPQHCLRNRSKELTKLSAKTYKSKAEALRSKMVIAACRWQPLISSLQSTEKEVEAHGNPPDDVYNRYYLLQALQQQKIGEAKEYLELLAQSNIPPLVDYLTSLTTAE